MNTTPETSPVSKTSNINKVSLEKKLSSALRHIKKDLILVGRSSKTGKPIIFELSTMTTDEIEKLLLEAVRGLLE